MNYEAHDIAGIFPMIQGAEFTELVADVREHGVREPIWLFEGKILDGRNRYAAANECGIECEVREYTGDDPVGFVLSLNLHRRHLNESQRAMVAASIANLPIGGDGRNQHTEGTANLQTPSRAQAAEKLNVSERTVNTAKKVQRDGTPELTDAVQSGRVSVSAAADVATLPPDEQKEIVHAGPAAIREAAKAVREGKHVHVSSNSGNDEWYTPPEFIESARMAMGSIDTDPASCEVGQSNVQAVTYFTKDDDGLSQEWSGNVWLNPPYSKELIGNFVATACEKFESGEFDAACILVNNATETAWGQALLSASTAACFVNKRIKYLNRDGVQNKTGLQGQMVCYLGRDVSRFADAFADHGVILTNG